MPKFKNLVILSRHKLPPEVKRILKKIFGDNIRIVRVNKDIKHIGDIKEIINRYGKDAYYFVTSSSLMQYLFKSFGVRVFHISYIKVTNTNPEIRAMYKVKAIYEIEHIDIKIKTIYINEDCDKIITNSNFTRSKSRKYAAVVDQNGKIIMVKKVNQYKKLVKKYGNKGYHIVIIDDKALKKDRRSPVDCGALYEWMEKDYVDIVD